MDSLVCVTMLLGADQLSTVTPQKDCLAWAVSLSWLGLLLCSFSLFLAFS